MKRLIEVEPSKGEGRFEQIIKDIRQLWANTLPTCGVYVFLFLFFVALIEFVHTGGVVPMRHRPEAMGKKNGHLKRKKEEERRKQKVLNTSQDLRFCSILTWAVLFCDSYSCLVHYNCEQIFYVHPVVFHLNNNTEGDSDPWKRKDQ